MCVRRTRYPVEAELRAMARKDLLAEADNDGIVITYMGFDLQDPQTAQKRRGFDDSTFAGSSACAEFAASLIVDLMVSPAETSILLETSVACKDFWHPRLEKAIHAWDRRQQVQGNWPGVVLREKAASILDKLSFEELCVCTREQFSEQLFQMTPPFCFLATAPKRQSIPEDEGKTKNVKKKMEDTGNTFSVLVTDTCAYVVDPHKHRDHKEESLGMLVACYTFPTTGDKWLPLANFIYGVVLAGMDCSTLQVDICVVTQKKEQSEKDEEMEEAAKNQAQEEEEKKPKANKKRTRSKRRKDEVERIMERDEEEEEKPKQKRTRSKKDLVEGKQMTRAQREEEEERLHHHKQAIACFIETSTWRETMRLRELKEAASELLKGTDVVMENKVFNAALKLVEDEISCSEKFVETEKRDMGKRLSAIKLVFDLVKPDLSPVGELAPAKCSSARAFSACAREAACSLDKALDLTLDQITSSTEARMRALQDISATAETLAQELAHGGRVKHACRSSKKLGLLIPVHYFQTLVVKVNQRKIGIDMPALTIFQVAVERLIDSHMRSLQVLLAMGSRGKGQVVNVHHVKALDLVTCGRFDAQGQRAYIEGLRVAGGQKHKATSESVALDSKKLFLEDRYIRDICKHVGVRLAPQARELLREEYASLMLKFFSDCVEAGDGHHVSPQDVVGGLRAEAYRYAGHN